MPLKFNQRLLLCNAYPSKDSLIITKNDKESLADDKHKLGYKGCRYADTVVQQNDKLDFMLQNQGLHATFEISELPTSDAVLLLVFEKKESGSSRVSFQSFAFPTSHDKSSTEAQLAVIDAFRGNSSAPHLKMEDHIAGKEKQTVSKRVEQLSFNRVYAIEEGSYDASVVERLTDHTSEVVPGSKHTMKLSKNQNYVVLRTGDEQSGEVQSLVVFPEAEFKSAGSRAVSGVGATVSALLLCLGLAAL